MSSLVCDLSMAEDVVIHEALPLVDVEALAPFAEKVLHQLDLAPPLTLSLHITTNAHSQAMNLAYRGVDAPTDILSFEAEPLPEELAEFETPHLGDLIMAYEYTVDQALAQDHAPVDEFRLLIVHGILHLVGYTHDDQTNQQTMWAKQAELLAHYGIHITVPDYIHGEDDED